MGPPPSAHPLRSQSRAASEFRAGVCDGVSQVPHGRLSPPPLALRKQQGYMGMPPMKMPSHACRASYEETLAPTLSPWWWRACVSACPRMCLSPLKD